jgi:hypothetical protein
MSDGPHKSLPMRNGWRNLAKRGANTNFDAEEICAAVPDAIGDDWVEEGCDHAVRELRQILKDNQQGSLFGQQREDTIESLKVVSAQGSPFRRMIIESVIQASESNPDPATALRAGVESALAQRLLRGSLQVEEHYLRSGDAAASTIRARIAEGIAKVPPASLADHFLSRGSTSLLHSEKRDGLDDGPRLHDV